MKKGNGFTLIELMIIIALLSLAFLGGYILIKGVIDNSKNTISKATEKLIINAAEQYALEFSGSEKWNEEVIDNNSYFCISLESLINYGYFNNKKIDEYKDKYIVRMIIKNGVYDYEVIEKELATNVCKYYKKETTIKENSSGNFNIQENGNDIGLINYELKQISGNSYSMRLNLGIDFKVEEIVKTIPTYAVLVVDKSGSMSGINKYEKARTAAIDFSDKIISSIPSSNIALIQYDTKPLLKTNGFIKNKLDINYFESASGSTNTSGAIDLATSLFYNLGKEVNINEANLYTILLYDGVPNYYSYVDNNGVKLNSYNIDNTNKELYFRKFLLNNTSAHCSKCEKYVMASSNYLKDINSNLIVVGYEMDNVNSNLKTIATKNKDFCKNSDYNDFCYYNSNSSNVTDLFDNISSSIIENVKSTDVRKVKIVLTPTKIEGEPVFIIKKDNIAQDSIEESLDLSNQEESVKLEINDSYQLVLNEKVFKDCKSEDCTKNVKLFNTKLILEYDDKEDKVVEIENVPNIVITSAAVITIN